MARTGPIDIWSWEQPISLSSHRLSFDWWEKSGPSSELACPESQVTSVISNWVRTRVSFLLPGFHCGNTNQSKANNLILTPFKTLRCPRLKFGKFHYIDSKKCTIQWLGGFFFVFFKTASIQLPNTQSGHTERCRLCGLCKLCSCALDRGACLRKPERAETRYVPLTKPYAEELSCACRRGALFLTLPKSTLGMGQWWPGATLELI